MFNINYYKEHQIFVDNIRKFSNSEVKPHLKKWEADNNFPDQLFKLLGQNGFLGILIPENYDGVGGDHRLAAAWCETFGEVCDVGMGTAVNMHSLVISAALAKYGSEDSKDKWLKKAVAGDSIGAYAFTEPGAGSDLANIKTKAEKKGNTWIINGAKTFITNGARANFVLVLARNDFSAGVKGFTTFVVDTTLPGFKVNRKLDKLGWRSSDTAELSFDNLELQDQDVLGQIGEGWTQAANNLNWERLMLTLTTLGGARACFQDVLFYAKNRTAFSKSLIQIDAMRAYLKLMLEKIYFSEVITRHALELFCANQPCKAEVSYAKRYVCENAVWIADKAIQIHGGYGYTREFSAEKWWRELRLMTIGGGTSEIMGNIIAKEIGL